VGRLALCWLACSACSFRREQAASSTIDAATDAAADAAPDATRATCSERWLAGTVRFAKPTPIAEVNTPGYDRDPFLPRDELTLYLSSARTPAVGGADVFVATRARTDQPFSTPTVFAPASTTGFDSKLSMTSSGTLFVLATDQPGGQGGPDIWEATRGQANAAWSALAETHEGALDDANNQLDPQISADGLHLYYANGNFPQVVTVASRANTTASFASPQPIASIASTFSQADPTVTPDERVLVYSSGRTDIAFANGNLWYATRTDPAQPFGAPQPVPDVNTDGSEGDGHLSADGCRLYFARDALNDGNWDIYVAAMM